MAIPLSRSNSNQFNEREENKMSAWKEYQWDYIAPGATVGVYDHGYANNDVTVYSAVVYALPGEAYYPLGRINLSQGIVARHVDGTVAREAWVQNLASNNPCAVDLNIIVESY
jgi:hypothetical protein